MNKRMSCKTKVRLHGDKVVTSYNVKRRDEFMNERRVVERVIFREKCKHDNLTHPTIKIFISLITLNFIPFR